MHVSTCIYVSAAAHGVPTLLVIPRSQSSEAMGPQKSGAMCTYDMGPQKPGAMYTYGMGGPGPGPGTLELNGPGPEFVCLRRVHATSNNWYKNCNF